MNRNMARLQELIRKQNFGIEQRTEKWYEARKKIFTASDFASICKLDKSCISLFEKKIQGVTLNLNQMEAILNGVAFEQVAIAFYEKKMNTKIIEFGLMMDEATSFLGASPDGISSSGVMLEIKCPLTRELKDSIPVNYFYQMQGQLDICQLTECDYLECKFVKYCSFDAFIQDSTQDNVFESLDRLKPKGVLIFTQNPEGVILGHSFVALFNSDIKDVETLKQWINQQTTELLSKNSFHCNIWYWKLNEYALKKVKRNDAFVADMKNRLTECHNVFQKCHDPYYLNGLKTGRIPMVKQARLEYDPLECIENLNI